MQSPQFPRSLVPPTSKYSSQHHVLKHPQLPFLPQCQRPSFTPLQKLWYAYPIWHAVFTAVPVLLYLFCPTRVSALWRICVCTHISDCVETVYELPSLPDNTVKHFCTNRDLCKSLTWYLSVGYRPGGDWANAWNMKCFKILFWNRK